MTASEQEHLHPPQEPDLLSSRWIAGVMAGTIALTVILSVVASGVVRHYQQVHTAQRVPTGALDEVPARELETGPTGLTSVLEFEAFESERPGERSGPERPGQGQRDRADERARLGSWAWVEREAGLVRMPIDEAITLIAEEQQR